VGIRGAGQCATAVKAFDAAEASLVVGNWVHVTILIGPAGRTRVCQTLRTIRGGMGRFRARQKVARNRQSAAACGNGRFHPDR
jgi:hypothetical protein